MSGVPLDVDGFEIEAGVCGSCGIHPAPDGAVCAYCAAVVPDPLVPPVHGQTYEGPRGYRRYCAVCWMYYELGATCSHLELAKAVA